MRFARFDRTLTKAAGFKNKDSKIGLRADGSAREVLKGYDWTLRKYQCFVRDKYQCISCHVSGVLIRVEIDAHHIVPKGKGGGDDLANLETRCRKCHNHAHPEKQVRFSKTA